MSARAPHLAAAEWWHFSLSLGLVLVAGLCTALAFWYTVLTAVGVMPESSLGVASRIVRQARPSSAPGGPWANAVLSPAALSL